MAAPIHGSRVLRDSTVNGQVVVGDDLPLGVRAGYVDRRRSEGLLITEGPTGELDSQKPGEPLASNPTGCPGAFPSP